MVQVIRQKQGEEGCVEKENTLCASSLYILWNISNEGYKPLCRHSAYPKCSSKAVLKVGGDAHEQGLAAGDHGHASGQVSHHVVCSHTHAGLLRIQGKVLPDDLLTGCHGNFDRTVNHRVHQLLDSSLY